MVHWTHVGSSASKPESDAGLKHQVGKQSLQVCKKQKSGSTKKYLILQNVRNIPYNSGHQISMFNIN